MQLSKNFTLEELIQSATADRKGIDNTPSGTVINNLKALCENVLQPLRDWYGFPIVISSGYRSERLNRAIGGSRTSQHVQGMAADIKFPKADYKKVFEYIRSNMRFDQLIWEFGDHTAPQWIHVSYNSFYNRKQVMRAVRKSFGKTAYVSM